MNNFMSNARPEINNDLPAGRNKLSDHDISRFLELISAEATQTRKVMEASLLHLAYLNLGRDRIISFLYDDKDIKFWLPYALSDLVQKRILLNRTFFEFKFIDSIRPYIRHGATVIDIGANIGNHTVYMSRICGAGAVHAFEPQQAARNILEKNIALNNLQNVLVHPQALGASAGAASIQAYFTGNLGATSFNLSENGEFEVIALDDLALSDISFIKIDVEGGQMPVLEGARRTIEDSSPVIFIELLNAKKEFDEPDALLKSLGYKGKEVHNDNFIYVRD